MKAADFKVPRDWRHESARDVSWGDWERQESRDAARHSTAYCYRHHYSPDGRGGGVCRCGETVDVEEI